MTDQNPGAAPPPYDPAQGATPPPAAPAPDAPPAYGTAPAYGAAPTYGAAPAYGAPAAVDPGKTMGIVALVAVFFISILGLILGYVARSQSKKAGFSNTPAKIAIILGWIFLVLSIIAVIALIVIAFAAAGSIAELCRGMDPGVYTTDTGVTVTCP
ncbi:DUF4190 domain-containing protein [Microbacterium sulfonylureivorans]|uniref:DUF4190 domain-containing protein n=1 Tax=Microbacterium sulfonylureivorans TaxID=2486854 RepID=UPI0013DECD6B|nr:DUF4190 domain-containing protein [Microbacterium sulfonylureivorans]